MTISQQLLTGRVCIITGTTSGIGRQVALELAKLDARVLMICRSWERGEQVRAEIILKSENEAVDLFIADLSDQAQIRRVASEVLSELDQIHILIHNAGLLKAERVLTSDGLEMTFAVNHIAPFLLNLFEFHRQSRHNNLILIVQIRQEQLPLQKISKNSQRKQQVQLFPDKALPLLITDVQLPTLNNIRNLNTMSEKK